MKDVNEAALVAEHLVEQVSELDAEIAVTALAVATGQVIATRYAQSTTDVLTEAIDTVCDTVTELVQPED